MSISTFCRYIQRASGLYHSKRVILSSCETNATQLRFSSLYEPDYLEIAHEAEEKYRNPQQGLLTSWLQDLLDTGKSKIPLYGALNVQIKGYDFPVLENFQKFVHKIAENMSIEVEDGWASPPQHLKIQRYKPQSTIVDAEYNLSVYERNVQIVDVPSTVFSVFLEVLRTALPEGVTLRVHEHEQDYEEVRYVPDSDLLELKSQLETLGGPSKKK